jgi:integrase
MKGEGTVTNKRGNGEGSIYRRARDGRYCASISLPDGKRKTFTSKTRAEVAAKMAAALNAARTGLPLASERQTVRTYLAAWLETVKASKKPKMYRAYEHLVRLHIVPTLGKVTLARLTAQQVQQLYARKLAPDSGLSQTTVHHPHAVLHTALKVAFKQGLVAHNVCDLVDAPAAARKEMHVLTPDEVRALLEAAQGERLQALYILAVQTGMRNGELRALRWQDVDLEAGTLSIQHTLQEIPGQPLTVVPTKTKKSRRTIHLSATPLEALRAHRTRQLEERLAMGPDWQDLGFVFSTSMGTPLYATEVPRRGLYPLLKKARLPRIRFHDLRHTAATLALKKRMPVKLVSDMLGHATTAITSDLYQHVTPDMQLEVADAIEQLLHG